MTAVRLAALKAAGFESVLDLVEHYPTRHLDARKVVPLNRLRSCLYKPVTIIARVLTSRAIMGSKGKSRAEIALTDESGGTVTIVFFAYAEWRAKLYKKGDEYAVIGFPGMFNDRVQIVQPPYMERITEDEKRAGSILPIAIWLRDFILRNLRSPTTWDEMEWEQSWKWARD